MFDLMLALLLIVLVGTPIVLAYEEAKEETDDD